MFCCSLVDQCEIKVFFELFYPRFDNVAVWTKTMIKTWQCDLKVIQSITPGHASALFCSLHCRMTQQSLSFCAFFCVHPCVAARHPGQQRAVQSIVECRACQQHQETKHLQPVKLLPPQRQAHHPDDQCAQAVQHHAGGGADLLSDTDPSKVEESDADGVAQQSQQDEGLVADLTEGIDCILQDLARVVTEAPNRNKIHGDEE